MRSLIIIEVEHGEDTDNVSDLTCWLESKAFENWSGLTVLDYTVRVDLPQCFTLEDDRPIKCGECKGTDGNHFLSCSIWPHNHKEV